MACEVVWSVHKSCKRLMGRKFASHAAVARAIEPGQQVIVQETNGTWIGWYRTIGVEVGDEGRYWKSRPQMEY